MSFKDELGEILIAKLPNPETGLYDVKTFLDSAERLHQSELNKAVDEAILLELRAIRRVSHDEAHSAEQCALVLACVDHRIAELTKGEQPSSSKSRKEEV